MYDIDPPDRGITEAICLDTFYNGLSPSCWKIPSLEYFIFLQWVFILLSKYGNKSLFSEVPTLLAHALQTSLFSCKLEQH